MKHFRIWVCAPARRELAESTMPAWNQAGYGVAVCREPDLLALGAAAIASAMARPAAGGSAIMDASVAQYFINVRRVTPCRARVSIKGPCMLPSRLEITLVTSG